MDNNNSCGSADCATEEKNQHVFNTDFLFVVYAVCTVQVYAAAMMSLFAV